ncbi:pimeloyl-ACP methyl ester carboxylesterase [Stenotrophomonas maltophilia]|uniref:alpha/beta fold hydrolase n=1 Tax=Stenotrophomonas chelatiphaga TaxID=517011 RepID=UPI000F4CC48A|nr:alpha/beta hydrolase [Stenotrophomonas chelatiphaga]MCS4232149.1 pimeloyl-ACP methyl ester carboxylesterase [Stenotrophomonas chelatiphaga]ROQ48516.1 pimeloyl-ACP methyl ester carboxylesterase [Stenotrophomonas maltophilia]
MKRFISADRARNVLPLAMGGLVALLACIGTTQAAPIGKPGQLQVEVVGSGKPVLMIPGLNSGAEVWRATCAALQPQVQCHLVQLPGFAGAAAADPLPEDFLPAMRDELLAYAKAQKLKQPAVVGHSLGGVLALQMAIAAPEAVGPLVIVDSLPFYAAIQNPQTTAAGVKPMADQMRAGMLAADPVAYQAQAEAALRGMLHDESHMPVLVRWARESDRATTAGAMHSMLVNDLRDAVAGIHSPTLVLGSWAAYRPMGATEASTRGIFAAQYAKLPGVRIEMSAEGFHFLMWDDPQWLYGRIRSFLKTTD